MHARFAISAGTGVGCEFVAPRSIFMMHQSEAIKIRFRGSDPQDVETLWAIPLGNDLYQLDNSPFLAYGVSWQDSVEAQPGRDGSLEFVRCVRKSGNRTLRIVLGDYRSDDPPAQAVLRGIRDLGCTYEGMHPKMVSVNVPPQVELDDVAAFLSEQVGLEWEYSDPTYDEVNAHGC